MTAAMTTPSALLATRWKISIVLSVSFFIAMLDRMNITYALPLIAEEFGWSLTEKKHYGSLLISFFYLAYGAANLLLTPIAARFGPRKSLICIVILWSVFTAMGAVFSQIMLVFLASRILLGLSEGVHIPMMNQLMKNWYPSYERSRGTSVWMIGLFIAILSGPLILVPIMSTMGWRAGFHVLALMGLLISLPLIIWIVRDHPSKAEDKELMQDEPPVSENRDRQWRQLKPYVFSPAFLLALGAGVSNNMVAVGITAWFPSFLESRNDVEYQQLAYLGAIPYIFSVLGLPLWAYLGDRFNARGRNAAIGFVVAATTLFFGFNQESLLLTISAFCVGVFFISSFSACEHPMIQHLFPAHLMVVGSGVYNGIAMTLGGALGSAALGQIMADGSAYINVWPLMVLFLAASGCSFALGRKANY